VAARDPAGAVEPSAASASPLPSRARNTSPARNGRPTLARVATRHPAEPSTASVTSPLADRTRDTRPSLAEGAARHPAGAAEPSAASASPLPSRARGTSPSLAEVATRHPAVTAEPSTATAISPLAGRAHNTCLARNAHPAPARVAARHPAVAVLAVPTALP
jgi:hypothetical protein